MNAAVYLTPADADAHVDHPTPADQLAQWRKWHPTIPDPAVCPKCNGYGGHNLRVNDYPLPPGTENTAANRHKHCHFRQSCMQCSGCGYVADARDAACAHEFAHEKNVGNCLNDYRCSKCGRVYQIDSSD